MEMKFSKLSFPFLYKKEEKPNYKVMELQAENEKLKDELIEQLKKRVTELEYQLNFGRYPQGLMGAQIPDPNEKDVGSHMIASAARSRVRTMSEVAMLLEKRSLNTVSLKDEPGDVNDKV